MTEFYIILTVTMIIIAVALAFAKNFKIPILIGPLLVVFVAYTMFFVNFMQSKPIKAYPDINKEYVYVWHRVNSNNEIVLWAIKKETGREALYIFPYSMKTNEQLERAKNGVKKKGKKHTIKFVMDPRKENSIKIEIKDKQVKMFKGINKNGGS